MPALTTPDYMASLPIQLRGKLPVEDTLLSLIETASEQVEHFCERILSKRTVIEDVRGTDTRVVMLREFPVWSIDSVSWTDDDGRTGTLDVAKFRFDSAGIVRLLSAMDWLYDYRTYTVEYTAGPDPIPSVVEHATALQTIELSQSNAGGPGAQAGVNAQTIVDLLDGVRRKGA